MCKVFPLLPMLAFAVNLCYDIFWYSLLSDLKQSIILYRIYCSHVAHLRKGLILQFSHKGTWFFWKIYSRFARKMGRGGGVEKFSIGKGKNIFQNIKKNQILPNYHWRLVYYRILINRWVEFIESWGIFRITLSLWTTCPYAHLYISNFSTHSPKHTNTQA